MTQEEKKPKKVKLSSAQIWVLSKWVKHPDEKCVTLSSGYFLTGGHGINIPKNTYRALQRMGFVGWNDRLTEFGKKFKPML